MNKFFSITIIFILCLSVLSQFTAQVSSFKGEINTTHDWLFKQARTILLNDGYQNIVDFLDMTDSSGITNLEWMMRGSREHDVNLDVDVQKFMYDGNGNHYMNPSTHSGLIYNNVLLSSAGSFAQSKIDEAIKFYHYGDYRSAAYYLGWATHMVQDVLSPPHSFVTFMGGHATWESEAEVMRENSDTITSGGIYTFTALGDYYAAKHYGASKTVFDWVDYNAHIGIQYYGLVNYKGADPFSIDPVVDQIVDLSGYSVETQHPIPNDVNTEYLVRDYSASYIGIKFKIIDMKQNDFINILDANGALVKSFTNGVTNDYSTVINGNTARIQIVTDSTDQSYGYLLDAVKFFDVAHDPAKATAEMLTLGQKTTAGFIHFFFSKVWSPNQPNNAEIVYSRTNGTTLHTPWISFFRPDSGVSINLKVKNIGSEHLHMRTTVNIKQILAADNSISVYDSTAKGEDVEYKLSPGEVSPNLSFKWKIPSQPDTPCYVVYITIKDWDNPKIIYDTEGSAGPYLNTNYGPLIYVPYPNSEAVIEWLGVNKYDLDPSAKRFQTYEEAAVIIALNKVVRTAVEHYAPQIIAKLASLAVIPLLTLMEMAVPVGAAPKLDAYGVDIKDWNLKKKLEITQGDTVPVKLILYTGDEVNELKVTIEKKELLLRKEIRSFTVPMYTGSKGFLDGWFSIWLKQEITFQDTGDYYIKVSYHNTIDEIAVTVKPLFQPIDLVMVLDISGSMSTKMGTITKIDALKSAANSVVNMLLKNDRVSIVTFATLGRIIIFDFTEDTDYAKTEIGKLSPQDNTSFGQGLSNALKEIDMYGLPNHKKVILFMSDGAHNTKPDPDTYIAECKKRGIQIYTVGFWDTRNINDENRLRWMAQETGGQFYLASSIVDLQNVFISQNLILSGWDLINNFIGSATQGQISSGGSFLVKPYTASLRVLLNYPGSDLDLILIRPNGTKVEVNRDSDVVFSGWDVKPEWVIILDPQEGNWQVNVYGKEVDGSDEPYNIWVTNYLTPDIIPPLTTLQITNPVKEELLSTTVNSTSSLTLDAIDPQPSSGLLATYFELSNSSYSTGWINASTPLKINIAKLTDGNYTLKYYSVDKASNKESDKLETIIFVTKLFYSLVVNSKYGITYGQGTYLKSQTASFGVTPQSIKVNASTRYDFAGWISSAGYTGPDRNVDYTITRNVTEEAKWVKSYLLVLNSDVKVNGAGWYQEGTTVNLDITDVEVPSGMEFMGFSGDVKSSEKTISFVMDKPKTIYLNWSTPINIGLVIGLLSTVFIVTGVVLFFRYKKGRKNDSGDLFKDLESDEFKFNI